ncbi:MAG TPA: HDIG domain-containing protein [Chloroflexota bacterium]|nr:HDIG domain-containing protein [Chloroflexota bacterium]
MKDIATMDRETLATHLARLFRDRGAELYLVGGAVRDQLLGQDDFDLDFATSAEPDTTASILATLGAGRPYRVGEKFGTIGLALDGRPVEITTYRTEEYEAGSRKPQVQFGRSLRADLERRDFTINAMARDPLTGDLIDPLGGRDDLVAGLIRAVGTPEERFAEDPLRLLRAVRFASRLGFHVDPETWSAMQRSAPALGSISRERVRDEYTKMLTGAEPVRALELLRDSALMAQSVPGLMELTRMPDHGPFHPLSLWDHAMRVVAAVPPLLTLRWAALLHDVAKPATRTHEPSGRPRFFGHEERGAEVAREILTDLRYSKDIVEGVVLLVSTHMQMHGYTDEWTDGAVRRLTMRLGTLTSEALMLARADASGHALAGQSSGSRRYDALESRIRTVQQQSPRLESPLSGDDLMTRYGRPAGPWIRDVKDALRDAVIDGALAAGDRDRAFQMADEIMAAQESGATP